MSVRLRHQLVSLRVPEHVMSEEPLKARDRNHLDVCLRCQAEAANYRVMLRALRALRASKETPPSGLVLGVMASIRRPVAEHRRTLDRAVVVGSVAVVAAAMALLGRSRLRPAN